MLYPNPQIYRHLETIFVHVPKTAGTSIEQHLRQSKSQVVGGHTTAIAYRSAFPIEFNAYFTFAIVRHPYDRFRSAYSYLKQHPINAALANESVHTSESINDFIATYSNTATIRDSIVHMFPQHIFVCDRDEAIILEAIYRYETLHSDWGKICRRIRIHECSLPVLNASHRRSTEDFVSAESKAILAKLYAKDFKLFGY